MTLLQQQLMSDISTGEPAMDKRYTVLFQNLERVAECDDDMFCNEYSVMVYHVEETFRQEEQWMEAISYPSAALHREQHARVLSALHHVHAKVMDGQTEDARDVVSRLLPQWLTFHIETMDATLAISMQVANNCVKRYVPLYIPNTDGRPLTVPIH